MNMMSIQPCFRSSFAAFVLLPLVISDRRDLYVYLIIIFNTAIAEYGTGGRRIRGGVY